MYITNFISFDIESLEQTVRSFILEHDHDPAFIIMSSKSLDCLKEYAMGKIELKTKNCSSNYYCTFQGIRFAVCDALPLGEVRVV